MIASQKLGVETPNNAMVLATKSSGVLARRADKTPTGKATIEAKRMVKTPSSTVTGRASRIISETGR